MNYYEQFYDDLEFEEEEPDHGYDEHWTHRDEKYSSPDKGRDRSRDRRDSGDDYPRQRREPEDDHQGRFDEYRDYDRPYDRGRDFDRDCERDYRDDWDQDRWQEYDDRGWSPRGRGRGNMERGRGFGDRGRGFNERGRGGNNRGRGFNDRERGFNDRGRGFNDRGRGRARGGRGRGLRGNNRGIPKMNFVKASGPPLFSQEAQATEAKVDQGAVDMPSVPVLSSYGYGPGSDFQDFGSTGAQQQQQPGVPGEETPAVQLPQQPDASQPAPSSSTGQTPTQSQPSKVVTAVVKPMYNFVKAKAEFKSTDVAFHETAQGKAPMGKPQGQVGIGMPTGQKVLQSFDAVAAFHAKAKDGHNPFFDGKFERLREAIKVCTLPQKNAIEVLHMAVDKAKMKITDIINPCGRSNVGQTLFMCKLEIDGVFVGQGSASNKKSAKHDAYTNAKNFMESGRMTVRETTPGVLELCLKEPLPVVQNISASEAEAALGPAMSQSPQANTTPYSKPQIVFHKPNHPMANMPLQFRGSQPPMQDSASAGELAMKLLNFVKEGSSSESQASESSNPPAKPNETPPAKPEENPSAKSQVKPGPSQPVKRTAVPNKNMLKRALDSVSAGNLRAKKAKMGPLSLPDLSQFVIIDNTLMHPNLSDISILHASANHNKVVLKFGYEMVKEGFQCNTVIGTHHVSSSIGKSKEDAKNEAAKEALEHLREICYTVKIKQDVDNDAEGMTKTALLSKEALNEQIPDNNIGNMLLRKMGWVGGGVGKDGKGIAEPVKAEMVIGREGLGLKAEKGTGKDFESNVTKMLTDYIKSDDQQDLHFSSELAKEERALIHQIGQKMGLKTQSKGKGAGRYLIVSRKRSVGELLEHVISSGGSTDKYEVVRPTNSDIDPRKREAISFGQFRQ